jgi:hypothetical protein
VETYRQIFGEGLVSIALYGSAARGDFRPGRSDINFLIVLDERAILDLPKSFAAAARWEKKGVPIPLFLSEEYIRGALDAYPLEFLDMKSGYRTVHGKDVLGPLRIERNAVRLQCERDARGHLLRLRQGIVASGGKTRALRSLAASCAPGLHALFRGLVLLLDGRVDGSREEIVRRACEGFGLRAAVFEDLGRARPGGRGEAVPPLAPLLDSVEELQKLVRAVDRMGEPGGRPRGKEGREP